MVKLVPLTIILIETNLIYCYIVLTINNLPFAQYKTNNNKKNTLNYYISRELNKPIFTQLVINKKTTKLNLLIKPKKENFLINGYKTLNSTSDIVKTFYNFNAAYLTSYSPQLNNDSLKLCLNYKAQKNVILLAEQICHFTDKLFYNDNINATNENKNIQFDFNLAKNIKDNITGLIGLNLYNESNIATTNNFLKYLYEAKIINNFYWYFDFNQWYNTKGKLVIGSLPHAVNETDFTLSRANYWEMEFNKVYFLNKTNNYTNNTINFYFETAELNFDSNVIIGTLKYKIFLSLMLHELIANGNCSEVKSFTEFEDDFNKVKNKYSYYFCNNNIEVLNKLNDIITTLYFYSSELNYTFEITKDQIIRTINKRYFINILFNNNITKANKWILGRPFIFKYKLIFNSDTRKIGFYNIDKFSKKINDTINDTNVTNNINNTNNNSNDTEVNNHIKKSNPNEKILKLIIIIVLLVYVCLGLILVSWKNITNKKNKEINNDEYKNLIEEKKDDNKIGIINPDDDYKEEKNKND